jgi:hypothetical protein
MKSTLFFNNLPDATHGDVRVRNIGNMKFAVIDPFRPNCRNGYSSVSLMGEEHTFDGNEVAGKEDKNQLIPAVWQQSRSGRPAFD